MTLPSEDLIAHANQIKLRYSPAQAAQLARLISPVSNCGPMTPNEFERVMEIMQAQSRRRAFSVRSIKAARLVLVMGASVAEAAAEADLARQVVHRLMMRIQARLRALPADWVRVDVWLPADAARQVTDLAHILNSEYEQGREVICSAGLQVEGVTT